MRVGKIRRLKSYAGLPFLVGLILLFPAFSSPVDAQGPQILSPQASPKVVQFGSQPEGHPLILSVELERAPSVKRVTVDLSRFFKASYYDPSSGEEKKVSAMTPLSRVYLVDGEPAYKVTEDSEEVIYRAAVTHEELDGEDISATRTWQIELPDVGLRQGEFKLQVAVRDQAGRRTTATIDLEVVDDQAPPKLSASRDYLLPTDVARPGDWVVIQAQAQDELTGVFRVRLGEEAERLFGEGIDLGLEKTQEGWKFQARVAQGMATGNYKLQVFAEDRAGNLGQSEVEVKVAEHIDSLKLKLKKGWNLISTPRRLAQPEVENLFADLPVAKVLTYLGGEKKEAKSLKPGLGYLVKSKEKVELELKFKERSPATPPQTIELPEGKSLIGFATPTLEPQMPLDTYLGRTLKEKWVVVHDEDMEEARYQSIYPYIWASKGFPTITDEPYFLDPSHNLPVVKPGRAYWLYLKDEGTLVP